MATEAPKVPDVLLLVPNEARIGGVDDPTFWQLVIGSPVNSVRYQIKVGQYNGRSLFASDNYKLDGDHA
jgi:hypothetical protein